MFRPTRRGMLQGLAASTCLGVMPHGQALACKASQPRFRFSLAAYSYRSLLTGDAPKMTLFDFIDDCVKFGLDGTELTSYYFAPDSPVEYLASLKQHCFRQAIDISGTAVRNEFGWPEAEKRDSEIVQLKAWIDRAALLGAPVIRIFAGHHKPNVDPKVSHDRMVAAMQECCDYAGTKGIHLALENHGGPTATADGLLRFVSDIDSPWFGVNLDTGNFHSDSIYEDLAKVAPHAINVQVKVVIKPAGKAQQATQFDRIAALLQEADYRGYVVLEYEEAGDPRSESERYLDELRAAFDQGL